MRCCITRCSGRCPHGFPIGATGLYIRADDMVKLGWLYLNRGVWNGKRLLSEKRVDRALERQYELHPAAGGLIGKGVMYGQGLYFSERGRFAVTWHVFEKGACMSALMEHLGALG